MLKNSLKNIRWTTECAVDDCYVLIEIKMKYCSVHQERFQLLKRLTNKNNLMKGKKMSLFNKKCSTEDCEGVAAADTGAVEETTPPTYPVKCNVCGEKFTAQLKSELEADAQKAGEESGEDTEEIEDAEESEKESSCAVEDCHAGCAEDEVSDTEILIEDEDEDEPEPPPVKKKVKRKARKKATKKKAKRKTKKKVKRKVKKKAKRKVKKKVVKKKAKKKAKKRGKKR